METPEAKNLSSIALWEQARFGRLAWRFRYFLGVVLVGCIGATAGVKKVESYLLAETANAVRDYGRTAYIRNHGFTREQRPQVNQIIAQTRGELITYYNRSPLFEEVFSPIFRSLSISQIAQQNQLVTLQQLRKQMQPGLIQQPAHQALMTHMNAHPEAYCGTETYLSDQVLFEYVNRALLAMVNDNQHTAWGADTAINLVHKYQLPMNVLQSFPGARRQYIHRLIREGQRNSDLRILVPNALRDNSWETEEEGYNYSELAGLPHEERAIVGRILCEGSTGYERYSRCDRWREITSNSR